MFSFTFGALVWLAHDVNRAVSNESAAQSIAFQAARTGAQAAVVDDLRGGVVTVDAGRACRDAGQTASRLFDSYGVVGSVTGCRVDGGSRRVTVEVAIDDGGRRVIGVGVVTAERVS